MGVALRPEAGLGTGYCLLTPDRGVPTTEYRAVSGHLTVYAYAATACLFHLTDCDIYRLNSTQIKPRFRVVC